MSSSSLQESCKQLTKTFGSEHPAIVTIINRCVLAHQFATSLRQLWASTTSPIPWLKPWCLVAPSQLALSCMHTSVTNALPSFTPLNSCLLAQIHFCTDSSVICSIYFSLAPFTERPHKHIQCFRYEPLLTYLHCNLVKLELASFVVAHNQLSFNKQTHIHFSTSTSVSTLYSPLQMCIIKLHTRYALACSGLPPHYWVSA